MGKKGKRPRFRVQFDIGKCSECKRNFTHQKKKHCTAAKQAGGTCKWMNEKRDYDRKSLTKRKALDQQQQVQEPDKPASADKAESTDQAAPINDDQAAPIHDDQAAAPINDDQAAPIHDDQAAPINDDTKVTFKKNDMLGLLSAMRVKMSISARARKVGL